MRRKENPGAAGTAAGARSKVEDCPKHIESPTGEQGRLIYLIRCSTRSGGDIRRLRGLLKVLLRRFGFRCISIEPEGRP
jgi:hypothetical protein